MSERGKIGRMLAVLVAVAAVSLIVAGLAGAKPTTAGSDNAVAAKVPASVLAAGKKLFKSNCASCHTLKQAGTHGTVGPNLNKLKLSLATIKNQITNGGRFMPPFGISAGGSLSAAKVKEIAEFVYTAQHSK